MVNVEVKDFTLDSSVVAKCIYSDFPHSTTHVGIHLSKTVSAEIARFLVEYNQFLKVSVSPFYRIDAYFKEGALTILEVNAAFVDGWGTAFNLARASGISIDRQNLSFPTYFATAEEEYRPELELLVQELGLMGMTNHEIVSYGETFLGPTYVYGRPNESPNPLRLPAEGWHLDDKRNLAAFSRVWQGEVVKIPRHFTHDVESWEDIPEASVLKFCDKTGQESQQARTSVLMGKPSGKAKFLKSCYNAGTLLAQEFVPPTVHDLGNMQVILLTAGEALVTGYTQFSQKKIINDNSTHGPLCFE